MAIKMDMEVNYMKIFLAIIIMFVVAISANACVSNVHEKNITIVLVGDSTVTDDVGWGKAFADRLNDKVKVLNFSKKGSSSKSFYNLKYFVPALKAKPDYIFIQFGHNGQPGKGPDRETDPATTYRDYLKIYINESRKIGATPILISSVTRRTFGKDGKVKPSLLPWAKAVKAVASEMKVPFIDLHTASVNYHNKIGKKASMALNAEPKDNTHLNKKGAEAIANLVVIDLKQVAPDIAAYLK